jgi:hypothetical protein
MLSRLAALVSICAVPAAAQVTDGELLFCAALFQLRVERLEDWQGDTTAADVWARTMGWALSGRTAPDPACDPLLLFTSCTRGWEVPIWHEKLRLRRLYDRMGLLQVYPETCMEDDACASCLDLIRVVAQ